MQVRFRNLVSYTLELNKRFYILSWLVFSIFSLTGFDWYSGFQLASYTEISS